MLVSQLKRPEGSTHELYFEKERIMTEERRSREIRQGNQRIRGSAKAVNIDRAGSVTLVLAASGTLHHVFQPSLERDGVNWASSLNSRVLDTSSQRFILRMRLAVGEDCAMVLPVATS